MVEEILNNIKALVLPKKTAAEIASIDATAEMGSIFYDTTNNKIMFVKNGGGSETVTSA
jgi:hypothetical protein